MSMLRLLLNLKRRPRASRTNVPPTRKIVRIPTRDNRAARAARWLSPTSGRRGDPTNHLKG